ncbi:transcriptional regulator, partial [Klebsiella pneumoniae]|nr:transcriptional regulator [Klebsiella pneumoniae]
VRQKGFSVAPNTLVIPLSDEECKNMNRVTLTHYQNNKVVDFISEEKEKPDTHLNLPLIENSSNHDSDLMANKTEEGEKV